LERRALLGRQTPVRNRARRSKLGHSSSASARI
jgi:hypothetical protein